MGKAKETKWELYFSSDSREWVEVYMWDSYGREICIKIEPDFIFNLDNLNEVLLGSKTEDKIQV